MGNAGSGIEAGHGGEHGQHHGIRKSSGNLARKAGLLEHPTSLTSSRDALHHSNSAFPNAPPNRPRILESRECQDDATVGPTVKDLERMSSSPAVDSPHRQKLAARASHRGSSFGLDVEKGGERDSLANERKDSWVVAVTGMMDGILSAAETVKEGMGSYFPNADGESTTSDETGRDSLSSIPLPGGFSKAKESQDKALPAGTNTESREIARMESGGIDSLANNVSEMTISPDQHARVELISTLERPPPSQPLPAAPTSVILHPALSHPLDGDHLLSPPLLRDDMLQYGQGQFSKESIIDAPPADIGDGNLPRRNYDSALVPATTTTSGTLTANKRAPAPAPVKLGTPSLLPAREWASEIAVPLSGLTERKPRPDVKISTEVTVLPNDADSCPSGPLPPTPNAPRLSRIAKYNSCSTLFVESTISNADLTDTLRCVASALVKHMRRNAKQKYFKTDDIFSEELHPLSQHFQFFRRTPSDDDVFKFLECLFHAAELTAECGIITLVYVERMLNNTKLTLHASNWTRIVLGGLVLASKVWDDHAVWNIDFVQIFPDVAVENMNELERWYMAALAFDVNVKASEYARYYFELRDLAEKTRKRWPLKPLTLRDAAKLEARTARPAPKAESSASNTPDIDHDGADTGSSAATSSTVHPFERGDGIEKSNTGMRRSRSDYIFVPSKPPAMVV
ncbi:hypothetical protein DFS34DRAFT_613754 [Phlyctochytrium arcticum]|nr:hypothetical protein DFS34DRAFT_613754 [Phlyctochytrium arcticum]